MQSHVNSHQLLGEERVNFIAIFQKWTQNGMITLILKATQQWVEVTGFSQVCLDPAFHHSNILHQELPTRADRSHLSVSCHCWKGHCLREGEVSIHRAARLNAQIQVALFCAAAPAKLVNDEHSWKTAPSAVNWTVNEELKWPNYKWYQWNQT